MKKIKEPMNIYQKLLEVQKEIKGIKKTETNPYFKSKYFDVNAILEELKPILSKYGLVLMQPFSIDGTKNVLTTEIIDAETKKAHRSSIYLPDALDPQKMGSAITYYRRYALQSMFALEAEDDDGNSASVPFPNAKMSDITQIKPKYKPHDYDGDEAHSNE